MQVVEKVLDYEPATNLAVLNGDLTSCEWIGPQVLNSYLDKIIAPFLRRRLPWAATFGNHDMSKTCNTRLMADHMWRTGNAGPAQLSFTSSFVRGNYHMVGTSNYYIPIYGSDGGGRPQLKMLLWFFDSKGGKQYQPEGVDAPVADWVDQQVMNHPCMYPGTIC